jgi:hypothetical protein
VPPHAADKSRSFTEGEFIARCDDLRRGQESPSSGRELRWPVSSPIHHAVWLLRGDGSPKLEPSERQDRLAGQAMAISHGDCTPFLSVTLLRIEKPPVTVGRLRSEILTHLRNATGVSITRTIHEVKAPTFSACRLDTLFGDAQPRVVRGRRPR